MPTALLVGAFGQRNPGDDALGEAFRAALPGWRTVMATGAPGGAARDGGRLAVDSGSPAAVLGALRHSDALVVGGGTVFKTLHRGSGRRPLSLLTKAVALTAAARALGKPRAMVGVGAGVLESSMSRRLARTLVHQTDLLVLRDEESAEVLAAAGAPTPFRIGADAGWTLMDAPAAPDSQAAGPIVVALSFLAGGPELPARLAAALAPLVEDGHDVRLQPWQLLDRGLDDLSLARAVNDHLPAPLEILDPPANLAAARDSFASASLVLGLRFHSLVAAGAAGTRFVALAHEPKLAGLARRLGQVAVSVSEPSDALTRAVRHQLRRPGPSQEAVASQIAAAEESMDLLRVLLAAGGSDDPRAEIEGLPLRSAA